MPVETRRTGVSHCGIEAAAGRTLFGHVTMLQGVRPRACVSAKHPRKWGIAGIYESQIARDGLRSRRQAAVVKRGSWVRIPPSGEELSRRESGSGWCLVLAREAEGPAYRLEDQPILGFVLGRRRR